MKLYLLIIAGLIFGFTIGAQPTIIKPPTSIRTLAVKADTSANRYRPSFESMTVYRIRVRITTGIGNSAGTDDPVYVEMNHNDKPFYLVKGIDNFREGYTEDYEVLSENIKTLKDIEFIKFGVKGDDGVCIKKLSLEINEKAIFSKTYSGSPGQCIDNHSSSLPATFEITKTELRSSPDWKYTAENAAIWKPFTAISREWLVALVEAAVGNQLYQQGGEIKWGTSPTVKAKYVDDHTVQLALNFEWDVTGPNPEVDINVYLEFVCDARHLVIRSGGGETDKTLLAGVDIGSFQEPDRTKISGITTAIYTIGKYFAFPMQFSEAVPKELSFGCNCGYDYNCELVVGGQYAETFFIYPRNINH